MAVDLLNLPSLRAIELREEAKTGNVVLAEITTTTECCPHCLRDHFHGHGVKEQRFADTPLHGKPTALLIRCQREPNFPQIWESKIPHPGYASASSVRTRPAFNFSFSRYELPRMLSVTA